MVSRPAFATLPWWLCVLVAVLVAGSWRPNIICRAATIEKGEVPPSHVLHERHPSDWARSWAKRYKVQQDATLPIRIGLKQSNIEEGQARLLRISDPSSPEFGQYMSAEDVVELFSPMQSSITAVKKWLISVGIAAHRISHSSNNQWVQFKAKIFEVEEIFFASYFIYEHRETRTRSIACEEYYMPEYIQNHVDYITPGVRLQAHPARLSIVSHKHRDRILHERDQSMSHNSSNCDRIVTPQCIANRYQIPPGTKARKGNELGIMETLSSHYEKAELDTYFNVLFPDIPNGTYPTERLINGALGAYNASGSVKEDSLEADVDFQSAWPIIWPQKTVLFQVDDAYYEFTELQPAYPTKGFLNTFYDAIDSGYCNYSAYGETGDCTAAECMDPVYPNENSDPHATYAGVRQCGVYEPTNVISISYLLEETKLPAYYLRRQCNEIMKLALQGVTILVAAGDSGVGAWPRGDNDSRTDYKAFSPVFAATCPYALAVGGTELNFVTNANGSRVLTETGARYYSSGGGFSNIFTRPDYQEHAVEHYLQTTPPPFGGYESPGNNLSNISNRLYHISGRAYPDVSIVGDWFQARNRGSWLFAGGTSLAAPIMAAILTRINEERLAVGKSTIGFVNPVLYRHPEVFFDVTNGSNPNDCGSPGFQAAEGWDPVSGLGLVLPYTHRA